MQVALVSGGSRGIGRAICERLACSAIRVHVLYHSNQAAAQKVVRSIESGGGSARSHRADVGSESDVKRVVADVLSEDGRIDILVNNAAVVEEQLLFSTSLENWERVLRTNLTGAFLLCREVIPVMLDQASGSVINVSSSSAASPGRGQTAYAASKGGLEALTRALAAEFGHKGIRANAVSPCLIDTDMSAAYRQRAGISSSEAGRPEDIASLVAFLASSDAEYIQGQVILADGGRLIARRKRAR
jgi:3-oxoacyl-[acyl-carrier protein] reductase